MSKEDITAEVLRRHHIFAGLKDNQLEKIRQAATIVNLQEHQPLFDAGQEAKYFYLVLEGRIQLYLTSPDGMEKTIHLVGPGETFAEALMFMDSPAYPINAGALAGSKLIAFPNRTFREILSESVDTCFRLMADMSTWLKKQLNEIDALTLQNATLRFINYLLNNTGQSEGAATVTLQAAKHVIASRLSIQPESFSRILRSMQREGLIQAQGNEIIIHDIQQLKNYGS